MTARHLIVVDVETNGLNVARHEAIEVAWWNLTTDERGTFIPQHSPNAVLAAADIEALRVNRYLDRIAPLPREEFDRYGHGAIKLWEQFGGPLDDDYTEPATAHTFAGSNPRFDAAMIAKLFANGEMTDALDPAPWHHRLWDLSAYAAGVLGLAELPGLRAVCDFLAVPGPDHTAEGDVTATGLCFRELQKLGAGRERADETSGPRGALEAS